MADGIADGTLLCILPGRSEVIATEDAGEKGCFGCRRRLPHTWFLLGDPFPSYYEPVWVIKCSRCGQDRTTFPTGEW